MNIKHKSDLESIKTIWGETMAGVGWQKDHDTEILLNSCDSKKKNNNIKTFSKIHNIRKKHFLHGLQSYSKQKAKTIKHDCSSLDFNYTGTGV